MLKEVSKSSFSSERVLHGRMEGDGKIGTWPFEVGNTLLRLL